MVALKHADSHLNLRAEPNENAAVIGREENSRIRRNARDCRAYRMRIRIWSGALRGRNQSEDEGKCALCGCACWALW